MNRNPDSFFALIERTNVALFAQWPGDQDYRRDAPQWIGTVADFWLMNPLYNLEHMRSLVGDLFNREHAKVGGGSEAKFTLIKTR